MRGKINQNTHPTGSPNPFVGQQKKEKGIEDLLCVIKHSSMKNTMTENKEVDD